MKVEDHLDWGAKCDQIAKDTEGLSGREISKLGVAWQVCSLTVSVLGGRTYFGLGFVDNHYLFTGDW